MPAVRRLRIADSLFEVCDESIEIDVRPDGLFLLHQHIASIDSIDLNQ